MRGFDARRDLLLGVAALERGMLDPEGLRTAIHAWATDPESSLGFILSQRGALSEAEHSHLLEVVESRLGSTAWHDAGRDQPKASNRSPVPGSIETGSDTGPGRDAARCRSAATACELVPPSRYRILRPHAQGGLGQIYLARDAELGRKVALKEMKPHHASNPIGRDRFISEARITSRLEHPGIVPVYGMGTHADGRPFYAMRFIDGETLAEAIQRFHGGGAGFDRVEFRWLLRRFITVCETVAYAHSRGVVHRDIKPSNIMLGRYGETLLMDWGVAKSVDGANREGSATEGATWGSEDTLLDARPPGAWETVTGQLVGTPLYMSPEQAAGAIDAVGPASDVYSLGATLYVLLTGERPFSGEVEEIRANARSGRFPRPRICNPRVPPALEAICLRAMALEPGDRYQSAQELGDELERYLADEPVTAFPDPWLARMKRWARRRRTLMASGAAAIAVALAALVIAVPILSLAWRAADRQRSLALASQANAEAQRDRAESALNFLVAAFRRPDPSIDGRSIKVVDLLDQAVRELHESETRQPLMSALLLQAIGQTYAGLGMAAESYNAHHSAWRIRTRHLGNSHPETIAALHSKALALQDLGRLDQAIPFLESTLAQRIRLLGPNHPDTCESMNDLAVAYWQSGRLDRAITLQEQALANTKARLGDHHPDTLTIMDNLGVSYAASGQSQKAIPLHSTCLNRFRTLLGDDHPTTLVALNNLARALEAAGQTSQAIQINQDAVLKLTQKLHEDHPTTLTCMHGLARILDRSGQLAQAIPIYRKTLNLREHRLGKDHPSTLATMGALVLAYAKAGDAGRARVLGQEYLGRVGPVESRLPEQLRNQIGEIRRHLAVGIASP